MGVGRRELGCRQPNEKAQSLLCLMVPAGSQADLQAASRHTIIPALQLGGWVFSGRRPARGLLTGIEAPSHFLRGGDGFKYIIYKLAEVL